jgi:hypothetical protein
LDFAECQVCRDMRKAGWSSASSKSSIAAVRGPPVAEFVPQERFDAFAVELGRCWKSISVEPPAQEVMIQAGDQVLKHVIPVKVQVQTI